MEQELAAARDPNYARHPSRCTPLPLAQLFGPDDIYWNATCGPLAHDWRFDGVPAAPPRYDVQLHGPLAETPLERLRLRFSRHLY